MAKTYCSNILHCDNETRYKCSKCKAAWYCGKDCQAQHYVIHKPYCEAIATKMTHPSQKVSRGVTLPDDCYHEMMIALKSGKPFELRGRDNVVTTTKLRPDGTPYEVPSGVKIVCMSSLMQSDEGATVQHLTIWGELTMACGSPVCTDYGYAAFYNKEKKIVYILHKASDTIVHSETRESFNKIVIYKTFDNNVMWTIE